MKYQHKLQERLDQYLLEQHVEYGLSVHTIAAYRSDLNQLLDWLQGKPITEDAIQHYVQYLRECELATRSIARKITSIRLFFNYLYDQKWISFKLDSILVPPKLSRRLPKILQSTDIQNLLSSPNSQVDQYPLRDRAILDVLYSSGCRISEISNIQLEDLREGPLIKLYGKRQKERWVPIGEPAYLVINAYMKEERSLISAKKISNYLFLNRFGDKLQRQSVYNIVKKYANRANIDYITPHMLRHSCATHLLEGKADIREVQQILGHENIETTEIYTHVARSSLKDQYRQYHPRR